jgi:hypothetical protein
MNIITTELQYQSTFFIVPQVTVRLGKSWNVSLNWLNFELEVKHISTALNDTNIFIHTPYVTLTSYMQSAYHLTFDLCWLGYTYRRGIWLKDGEEPRPADNTPGFVASGWFAQFRKDIDPLADIEQIIAGFRDALSRIKEEMEKE